MTFADLHRGPKPLLLPNAWDVPSALAFLDAGFEAIGTTSFGIASSLGHPDGGRATRDANLSLARDLAKLPVFINVDIEDGYSDEPAEVADYVSSLGAVGVAGVNIEDSTAHRLISPDLHAAKVAAIKGAVPDLFINARVDTYWLGQDDSVEATLARATRYVAAGADGIFLAGASDVDELREMAAAIPVPVNVLVIPGKSLDELGALGVRRVSTGSLPYRAAINAAAAVAAAVRDGRAVPGAMPYPDLQSRLAHYVESER
jgi:2-methylisocitrate lyase-like PEP mutase family enzyme